MLSLPPILKCCTVAWYNLWILSLYLSIFYRKQAFNKTWSQDKFFLSRRYLFIIFIIIQLRYEQLQRFYLLTQDKRYWLSGCQIKFWIQTILFWLCGRTCHSLARKRDTLEELLVKEPAEGIFKYMSVTTRDDLGCLTGLETANNPPSPSSKLKFNLLNTKFLKMYHFMTCLQVNKPNSHLVFLLYLICSHPLHINNFLPKQETKWN